MLGHELTEAYSKNFLYVLLMEDNGPYMESPVEQDPVFEHSSATLVDTIPKEMLLRVFVSLTDACEYKDYVEESYNDEKFTVKRITLDELLAVLTKLDEFTQNKHGHPLRVDLSLNESECFAETIDTLWCKYRTIH